MTDLTRRGFVKIGSAAGAALAGAAATGVLGAPQAQAAQAGGFQAATNAVQGPPGRGGPKVPGVQGIYALCEVTGGGQKVYGIAVQYDAAIDPASLARDTYTASVFPAARGFMPGVPQATDKNATTAPAVARPVAAIYTNSQPALLADQKIGPLLAEVEQQRKQSAQIPSA